MTLTLHSAPHGAVRARQSSNSRWLAARPTLTPTPPSPSLRWPLTSPVYPLRCSATPTHSRRASRSARAPRRRGRCARGSRLSTRGAPPSRGGYGRPTNGGASVTCSSAPAWPKHTAPKLRLGPRLAAPSEPWFPQGEMPCHRTGAHSPTWRPRSAQPLSRLLEVELSVPQCRRFHCLSFAFWPSRRSFLPWEWDWEHEARQNLGDWG